MRYDTQRGEKGVLLATRERASIALVGKRSTKLTQKDRGGWRGGRGWFEDD